MRPLRSVTPWLMTALLGLSACSGAPEDDDTTSPTTSPDPNESPTPSEDVDPGLSLGDVKVLSEPPGAYDIAFTLVGPGGARANMKAEYSFDQLSYKPAAVESASLTNLPVSTTGTEYTLRWESLTDLGYAKKKVYFRLSGTVSGNDFPPAVTPIEVDNTSFDKPCVVKITPPSLNDGNIPFTYTLTDARGDVCDVTVLVERGTQTAVATAATGSDPLLDVNVSSSGTVRTFVWDSLADIKAFDETVNFKVRATDMNNNSEDVISLDVRNDPTPDEGDLLFTEIFLWPDWAAFTYLEVHNVRNHPLNLGGLYLSTTGSPKLSLTTDLQLLPGELAVITSSAVSSTDLFTSDYIAGGLSLSRTTELVKLWRGDDASPIIIDQVSYDVAALGGKSVVQGKALGRAWDSFDALENNTLINWCLEDVLMPSTTTDTDYGTPGQPTHCTPVLAE